VTVNDAVADEVLRLNPEARVLRTGNGFDADLLDLPDTSADAPPFLLFIGRLDRFMKGLDLLVESFARLAPRFPDVTLVLAGRGDKQNEEALRRLAHARGVADRVIIRKDVGDADKRDLLARCLFFCSPSRFEGFGIAALEANAAGKAVVVSEASGYKASIADGVSGLRVDLARPENLDEAIAALLTDGARRAQLGRQGREWARGFGWDAIAEREAAWIQGIAPQIPRNIA
jgi:glycosyltransferase involved in cell wall biosynthesis